MTRLPYGSFQKMTKKQQHEHTLALARRFRENHREELNAKNKAYIERWKITKPFVVQCNWCGEDFNARRRCIKVCPKCHEKAHEQAQAVKNEIIARRNAKAYFMDKVAELHEKGFLQREIAQELGISQRSVSHLLLKMGFRSLKYHKRRK